MQDHPAADGCSPLVYEVNFLRNIGSVFVFLKISQVTGVNEGL
jgi:hypothetical protein